MTSMASFKKVTNVKRGINECLNIGLEKASSSFWSLGLISEIRNVKSKRTFFPFGLGKHELSLFLKIRKKQERERKRIIFLNVKANSGNYLYV